MEVDPKWEFDCPQFVDFNQPIHNDDDIDSFFETNHEYGAEEEIVDTKKRAMKIKRKSSNKKTPKKSKSDNSDFETPPSSIKSNIKKSAKKSAKKPDLKVPENLTEILSSTSDESKENMNLPKRKGKSNNKKPTISSRLQALGNKHLNKLYNLRMTPSRVLKEETNTPKKKKLKLVTKKNTPSLALSKALTGSIRSMKSRSLTNSLRRSARKSAKKLQCRSVSTENLSNLSRKVVHKPNTPQCLKRSTVKFSKNIKSSEELEMEKIANLRQQLTMHREIAKQSMKKAMMQPTNVSIGNNSSQTCHTVVKPFNFATDKRIKNSGQKQYKRERDFASSLRYNSPSATQSSNNRELTRPVPFKLTENRKRKLNFEENYQTLAEQIEAFQRGAFDKFDSTVKNIEDKGNGLTRPRTPRLRAKNRCRPVTALSQAQREELLLQEMKAYKFKATAINPKVINHSQNISKMTDESNRSETENRYMLRSRPNEDIMPFQFRANPVPEKILKGVVGIKEKPKILVTEPKSPALQMKYRAEMWKQRKVEEEKENYSMPTFKAQPLPHIGIPFHPKLETKTTITEPFSFEDRDRERWNMKELKIKEEMLRQRKMDEFHAQPVPNYSNKLPAVPRKPPTQLEPFNLLMEQRSKEKMDKWQKEMEEEMNRENEARIFKARPNKVVYKSPFVPEKCTKPLSDSTSIYLNTERRAEEREKFECLKKLYEREREEEFEKMLKEREEEERKEIARYRAKIVHKAQPVKYYQPMEIHPSKIKLTQPKSPCLSTKLRSKRLNSAV